jgi:predicted short-subunit dehydrogenase-like oxidoreductase (DUF2520 family)
MAIVGTGRMGRALTLLLAGRGIPVLAAAGRAPQAAAGSSHVLIAVADDALPAVAARLAAAGLRGAIVLHTSGAAGPAGLKALGEAGNATGVLHPLQTVPSPEAGVQSLPGSAFAYAGEAAAAEWALELIAALGGQPLAIDPARWALYHAAAVMACNYHATLVDCAFELMQGAGAGRDEAGRALAPLMRATTENLLKLGPADALTGPIRRGDVSTIRAHMAALQSAPAETLRLYSAAGLRTLALAGLPSETAEVMADALRLPTQS